MKNNKKATKKAVHKSASAKKSAARHVSSKKVIRKAAKMQKKQMKKAAKPLAKRVAKIPAKAVAVPRERKAKEAVDFRAANFADEALIKAVIDEPHFTNHVSRSVGKRAGEIIQLLATPQTDDAIAEKLDIKINEVRRMLNTLNTYGVARYNVNKDSKGWLTFKWYIDANKITEMKNDLVMRNGEGAYKLPEGCNDFFICGKCYSEEKTIFPFESAFEMGFKHECGGAMKQVNKMEVEQLVMQEGKIL
ncbi:MAG: hypothetical protein KGH54_00695 [Candidatus Micrarchaeota archaeon]|nr:hypothetical protein [Candidatus Micrarchaeota archaeon]